MLLLLPLLQALTLHSHGQAHRVNQAQALHPLRVQSIQPAGNECALSRQPWKQQQQTDSED
jgi:hypothetical protein